MGIGYLIFGNVDSRDYDIEVFFKDVDRTPKRVYKSIEVPGRNGAVLIDENRYEDVPFSYDCVALDDTYRKAFVNALASQIGYKRMQDSFNEGEFYSAVFDGDVDPNVTSDREKSTFSIYFTRSAQRYLLSGEEPQTIGEWHETETASGSIASFEAKDGDAVKSLVVDIEPLQSGSGTPSPTNVRPISGYDSVVVNRSGKNIVNELHHGNISGAGAYGTGDTRVTNATSATSSIIKVTAGQYTLSAQGLDYCTVLTKDNSGNIVDNFAGSWNSLPYTFTVTDEAWLYFTCRRSDNASITLADVAVQVEQGSTATAYEPYQGNTYSIDLDGTRYGGTLDVVSGVLTVTHVAVDLGSLTWEVWPGYTSIFRCGLPSGCKTVGNQGVPNWLCSAYVVTSGVSVSSTIGSIGQLHASYVLANNPSYTDASAFKTAMTGQTLVYELATPTTVQLTAQEVELLVGLNQIWANSGDVEVEYGTAPNVVYNPTLFESSPMLEVEGYGTIAFNGYEIELNDGPLGDTVVREKTSYSNKPRFYSDTFEITSLMANSGDNGTIGSSTYIAYCPLNYRDGDSYSIGNTTVRDYTGATAVPELIEGNILRLTVTIPNATFAVGTNFSKHGTVTQHITRTRGGVTEDGQFYFGFGLRQRDNAVRWNVGNFDELTTTQVFKPATGYCGCTEGAIVINSTVSILGQPTYIDCDLGEAYKTSGTDIFSLNPYIDLGSDLPKLASGANTITADNTVTDLKVVPRWWKI